MTMRSDSIVLSEEPLEISRLAWIHFSLHVVVESHKHGGEILCAPLPEHMPYLISSELSKTRLAMQPVPEGLSHEDIIHELRHILLVRGPALNVVVAHVGSMCVHRIFETGVCTLTNGSGLTMPDIRDDISHVIEGTHEVQGCLAHACRSLTGSVSQSYCKMSAPDPCSHRHLTETRAQTRGEMPAP